MVAPNQGDAPEHGRSVNYFLVGKSFMYNMCLQNDCSSLRVDPPIIDSTSGSAVNEPAGNKIRIARPFGREKAFWSLKNPPTASTQEGGRGKQTAAELPPSILPPCSTHGTRNAGEDFVRCTPNTIRAGGRRERKRRSIVESLRVVKGKAGSMARFDDG